MKKIALLLFLSLGMAVAGYVAVEWATDEYDLTARQLMRKALAKAGLDLGWLHALVSAGPLFPDHVIDGRLRSGHPRVFIPELAGQPWSRLRDHMTERAREQRQAHEPLPGCKQDQLIVETICGLIGDRAAEARAVRKLALYQPARPAFPDTPGSLWELALAYDLLYSHPALTDRQRAEIEIRIRRHLSGLLAVLDTDSPSLWHSRAI